MSGKQVVRDFIQAAFVDGDLGRLGQFWTEDCVNHAAPAPNVGLDALRAYHAQFAAMFAEFQDIRTEVVQQVEEADRVATHLLSSAVHRTTGDRASMTTMRLDRLRDGRIAEHWSAAAMGGPPS